MNAHRLAGLLLTCILSLSRVHSVAADREGNAPGRQVTGAFGARPVIGPPATIQTGAGASGGDLPGASVRRKKYAAVTPDDARDPAQQGLVGTPAAEGEGAQPGVAGTPGTEGDSTQPGATRKAGATTLKVPAGRMSWREVSNWRELHEAANK